MTSRNQVTFASFALFAILFITSSSTAAVIATETWDDDKAGTAGWVGNTTSATVVHVSDGGNPDGHIQSRRSGNFDIGALIDSDVSSDFTGDYAGIDTVSFDATLDTGLVSELWLRFRRGPSENGWRFPFGGIIAEERNGGDSWANYSVTFDAAWSDVQAAGAGWIQEMGSPAFADLMSAVDTAEVRFAGSSTLLVGIDNFSIVPEPTTGMLLVLSLFGLVCLRSRGCSN